MKKLMLQTSLLTLIAAVMLTGCGHKNDTNTGGSSSASTTKSTGASDKSKSIVQYLGISKKEFKKERREGKSIVDIAKGQSKTEQQVLNYMLNQRMAKLKNKSKLTDAQLSKKKAAMTQKIQTKIENKEKPKKKKQGSGQ